MTTFTEKETKLLTACMRCMIADVSHSIDFDKVAIEAGYKDAKNAKTMFSRLKKAKFDSATTGTALPKPTTPSKKGTGGTTAGRKGSNGGVAKATGGRGAKGGSAKKGAKAAVGGTNGVELQDDPEEDAMAIKAENSGSGDGELSELEVDGSGGGVVKDEHGDGDGGPVILGFTAINHPGVLEADELGDEEDA